MSTLKINRKTFPKDIIAGLTAAIAAIPDGMATASLAGVSPIYGLYNLMAGTHIATWERGTNENAYGLVRQYIPKKRDFSSVDDIDLDLIMSKLNHRPRKCLDFRSPYEGFFEHSVALMS